MILTELAYQFPILFLLAITLFMVYKDRSFSRRVRSGYIFVLYCSLVVTVLEAIPNTGVWMNILIPVKSLIYLTIVISWIYLVTHKRTEDSLKRTIIVFICCGVVAAIAMKVFLHANHVLNNAVASSVVIYYFYLVMQIYKTDGLTGLMTRHSLNFDMEEMGKKDCAISIIDIDNFKIINDKYGHAEGDLALKTIASVIRKHMLKGCRLYRFGGDEFAVLTVGVSDESLDKMFRDINEELDHSNYRISYGYAHHKPGEPLEEFVKKADERMYENKRLLKSEDIWDDMTGLYNLRGFLDEMETLGFQAQKEGKDIALVAMDIERLGSINMGYGYSEGNMIIQTVASVVKNGMDMHEFAGHLGSDEIVVAVLKDKGDEEYAKHVSDQIYSGVKYNQSFDGKEYSVELNMATLDIPFESLNELQYESYINHVLSIKNDKKERRRKSAYSHDDFEEVKIDSEEEAFALDIIDNNKLEYALQPIVSAKDGEIVAYEALMRTATEPSLSPLSILRYASKNKRDYDIEKLTFNNILNRLAIDTRIPKNAKIFMNSIPGYTIKDEDYFVLRNKYPDLFKRLVIEITEQSELDDEALGVINRRKEEDGYMLAIDDYGSGNSNTYSLLRYRPEVIKLDRLLINNIDQNTKKQYFVNSIITFAKENGMQVLAEGVETEAELKMMIRLQVDYIQGFFTARPSVEPVAEIDEDKKKLIISENIRGVVEGNRKIFIASNVPEVSLVQLALEEYTGITVAQEYLKIIGNPDYVADMIIKVKDGITCELYLQDVRLNSVDDMPCIELGEGANVVVRVEGHCNLNNKGIRVPEGSSLIIKGPGELDILSKGHAAYGIGGNVNDTFGDIIINNSGNMKVRMDGEHCIGIGGGYYKSGKGVTILSGIIDVSVASVSGVGIGSIYGDVPIRIYNCVLNEAFRVNTGTAIGTLHGAQKIQLESFCVNIEASGVDVSAIGSIYNTNGQISFVSGTLAVKMTGQNMILVGAKGGEIEIGVSHAKMDMRGEGNRVLVLGTEDMRSYIVLDEGNFTARVNSEVPVVYGAEDRNITVKGGVEPVLIINK